MIDLIGFWVVLTLSILPGAHVILLCVSTMISEYLRKITDNRRGSGLEDLTEKYLYIDLDKFHYTIGIAWFFTAIASAIALIAAPFNMMSGSDVVVGYIMFANMLSIPVAWFMLGVLGIYCTHKLFCMLGAIDGKVSKLLEKKDD